MRHLFNVQLAFLSILVIFSGFAFSQVPQLINYQGVLIDPSTDQPIPDDTYSITFSIYNVPSGSSDIWHEIHSVETKNGLYSVILGSITDLTSGILSGSEKYLGIKVGNDPEMIPRRRIVSVAYAIVSATADSLGDKAAAEYATKIELSTSDGDPPNQGSNQVSWDNLMDVPDGFADGIDNTGGSDGNTLDQAYDQGGPGAGRTIIADAGPVNIEGSGGLSVNGWVGIGITTPEHPLHVKGFFKLEGADFRMAEPSAGDGGRVLVHWGDGSGTNDQMILNFAGDFEEGVKIEGSKLVVNGKVGIGIIAPEHPLHVKGFFKLEGTDFLMADPSRGDGGRALVHWGDGSGTDDQLILNFAGDFEEGVNVQGSKLIIDGQVGIGIADPGNRKLNVVGGSNTAIEASSTGGNAIYATSSAYSAIHAHANCGGGDAAGYFTASEYGTYGVYAKSEDYDALYASSNAASNAAIRAVASSGAYAGIFNGKVGIGDDSPTNMLDVAGKIGINDKQVLYLPDQNEFFGTLYLGDGGGSLSHSTDSTGYFNTAVGIGALYKNTQGIVNTACGSGALRNNSIGVGNTACGRNALYYNTWGSFNTAIGFYAGNTSANLHNATAVGAYANVNASNKVVIGNTDVTIISGYANWSTFSDGRFKHAVQENIKGLDFITRLRPVSYKMDVAALNAHLGVKNEAESEYVSNSNKGDIVYSGFIGQELEAAAQEVSYDFSGVVPPQNEKDHYSLRYAEFVVPLVKAVQEQQKMIEQLQNEVAALKKRLVE